MLTDHELSAMVSKCEECDFADPVEIASCGYCGKTLCDSCYATRHANKQCAALRASGVAVEDDHDHD